MSSFYGPSSLSSSPLSNRDNAARLLQRSQLEKSMMLKEIQELKAQLRAVSMGKADGGTNSLTLGGSPDGRRAQTFNRLLESNLRTGTLACCWCLKFILTRRLGRAFSTWRLNARLLTANLLMSVSSSSSGSSSSNDPNSSFAVDGASSPKGKGRKGKGKEADSTPSTPEVPLRISIKRGGDDSSPMSSISGIDRMGSPQSATRARGAVGSSSSGNGAGGGLGGIGSSSNSSNIGGSGPGGPSSALRIKTPSSGSLGAALGGSRTASGSGGAGKGNGTPRYLSATKASTHRQWGFYVGDDSTLRFELDDEPEAEAEAGAGAGRGGYVRQTSGFNYDQEQSGFFSPQREREKRRQKQSRVTPGGGSSSTLLLPTSSARKKVVSPKVDADPSKLRSSDPSSAALSPLNNSAGSGGKGKERPLYAAQLRLFSGEDGEHRKIDYDRNLRKY